MLKSKIVLKVNIISEKYRKRAMKIAAVTDGVSSLAIDEQKNLVVVTGVGIDAATLANSLREKVGYTAIISIEVLKTEAPKKDEEAVKNNIVPRSYSHCNCTTTYAFPTPPPGYHMVMVCSNATPGYPTTWFTWCACSYYK